MGSSYETRLTAFAEGKGLARLSKVVREQGVCDACGSTQPRALFGLRDTISGRHYFLGQNCLAWLLERRLVARARYRESAEVAYRREMELRGQGVSRVVPAARQMERQVRPAPSTNGSTSLPARVDGLLTAPELDSGFRWVREGGALVLHRVVEPIEADLEAFFRAAYLLARDHLLSEGHLPVLERTKD